ncbi:hypothetical protein CONCODRAFT_10094 [Conidiobolus coronatus NRRL 28638]|uniref:Uncharacterized protein n=1 Tax=Conidiobolus coronatus (strain ATCC 28846 / CBS 209.66 / NRRL 28638) TaxID=796925 RepID=A0A137NYU0_CONC2|nr:hypothetical protein CONCODRAFT_10094 [Conidiobolus coronatus NRRL 28638]|eukprot:KXN67769.1 hypothetical protein CONCODRAFT_10094 [Conidiobolus coronatus NRRL 28638]
MNLAILLTLNSIVSASSAKCFFRFSWKPELSKKITEICCFESVGEFTFKTCCFFKVGSAEFYD